MENRPLLCMLMALCCCVLVQAQSCPDNRILSAPADNFEAGYQHLEAQTFIAASNQVLGSAKITYDAGSYILLQSGFYAAATEPFWALTDGCGGNVTDTKAADWWSGTTVSPNPTTGLLQVSFSRISDHALTIVCFDLLGRELLREKLLPGSNKTTLDISALPSGIYLLRLNDTQTPTVTHYAGRSLLIPKYF